MSSNDTTKFNKTTYMQTQFTKESWEDILQECTETLNFLSKIDIELSEKILYQPKMVLSDVFNLRVPERIKVYFSEEKGSLVYNMQQEKKTYLLAEANQKTKKRNPYFNIHTAWSQKHPWNQY